jgi:predicted transcriptional regulator of viral defense system
MPPSSSIDKALAIFRQHQGVMRTSQAIGQGIAPRTLYALRDTGLITQESRGLYRLSEMPAGSYSDLIQVALKVPKGVICLISALAFHELTTQIPHYVYLALPQSSEKPRLAYPPIRIFWLSQGPFSNGVEEHILEGVPVRIYSREKTVADCFKFRNKIGLDVALEALKDCLQTKRCQIDLLERYARIDRVENVLRPYLEALL